MYTAWFFCNDLTDIDPHPCCFAQKHDFTSQSRKLHPHDSRGNGSGVFKYENAQGQKEISFGFGYNVFSEFPEDGYFDMEIGKSVPGHRYPIAASAKWQDARTLIINVQFIGRHLGGDIITLTFDGESAVLNMHKSTNCFLDRYNGECIGRK